MLDKVEPPSIPEGYAMSVAFSALLDLVRGITTMIERELAVEEEAAAEFREAHPDQEWQPQPGKNGQVGKLNAGGNYTSCLCFTAWLPNPLGFWVVALS